MHVVQKLLDALHGFVRGVGLFLRNCAEGEQNCKVHRTGIVEEASYYLPDALFSFIV